MFVVDVVFSNFLIFLYKKTVFILLIRKSKLLEILIKNISAIRCQYFFYLHFSLYVLTTKYEKHLKVKS